MLIPAADRYLEESNNQKEPLQFGKQHSAKGVRQGEYRQLDQYSWTIHHRLAAIAITIWTSR